MRIPEGGLPNTVKIRFPVVDLSALDRASASHAHLGAVHQVQLGGGGALEFWMPYLDGVATRIIDDVEPFDGRLYEMWRPFLRARAAVVD